MTAPSDPRPTSRSLLSQPAVVMYMATMLMMEIGMTAQFTALGKRVFDIDGRALDLGWLGLAEFLPVALLVLVAGPVADRFDRRRISAIALGVEAAVSFLLLDVVRNPAAKIGPILLCVVAYASSRAMLSPALRSLPANIVTAEELPAMIALNSAAWQGGVIIGPVLGGLLYAIDVWVPFALSAVLLLVAAVLISLVKVHSTAAARSGPSPSIRAQLNEAFDGLRLIRREPVLLGAISLDLFAVLFGGAVALLPAIAEDRLGVGVVGLGWLRAAGGIGAAVTTLLIAARPISRRIGPVLFTSVAVFGAGTIVLGLTHSYVVAFLALMVLASADSVSVFIRSTLVPLITPDELRGRVSAVENLFIGASNELGAFESGVAGQLLGVSGAVVLGGVATIAIVVAWSTMFPAIRNLDGFPLTTRAEDS